MTASVGDILEALEALAPERLAEEWDNVGLQLGSRRWPVHRVMTALDPTPGVIQEVQAREGDVLVTHHPLIFSPLRSLDLDTPLGSMLLALLTGRIAVIAAHTNLDAVRGGVNDILASALHIQLEDILQPSALDGSCGIGRVGRLPSVTTLEDLAADIKDRMAVPHVRFAGDPQLPVRCVALCSGSGTSLTDSFLDTTAEVFITGDVRYHQARDIEAHGRGVIDIGHFESEHLILEKLAGLLAKQLAKRGLDISVEACLSERAPFRTI